MRRTCWLGIVLFVSGFARWVAAETPQQLRQQLEELQRKLDALPTPETPEPNRRVTEIGTSRAKPKEEYVPRTVTRIYDISDMFAVAPAYPARQPNLTTGGDESVFRWGSNHGEEDLPRGGGGMGGGGMGGGGMGGGGGVFSVPSSLSYRNEPLPQMGGSGGVGATNTGMRTSVDQLVEVIKTSITPDEWKANRATISLLGGAIVVTATDETQTQMGALLELFRKRWKSLRTISVRGYWVWLTEAELIDLLADPVTKGDLPPLDGLVKPNVWAELVRNTEGQRPQGYETAITCYNGQTVHTFSGEQKLIVSGVAPSFGTAEKSEIIAYEPVLSTVNEGAVLQMTPLATRNAKFVVLDLHSRVTLASILPQAERPVKLEPNDPLIVTSVIERASVQTQRISTTLRIPVDKTVLAGGMTFGNVPGRSLYFFVRGHIQELRDDETTEVGLKSNAIQEHP